MPALIPPDIDGPTPVVTSPRPDYTTLARLAYGTMPILHHGPSESGS